MLARRGWSTRPTFDNPFSDFEQLRREMLRLLGNTSADGTLMEAGAGVFPPINISQDTDNFYLRTELPGVKSSDISVTAVRNRVSIAGKREIAREHERVSYHRKERPEGSFNRTVTLPVEVDAARVDARYSDGILTLTLPKVEEAKPRQIAVRS
jgi:HSP20 family protein